MVCSRRTLAPAASWKQFLHQTVVQGIRTGDATNPPEKQGYATYTVVVDETKSDAPIRGLPIAPKEIVIRPGGEARCITFVAPGSSPAEAWGALAGLRGETGVESIFVTEGDEPVRTATIFVPEKSVDQVLHRLAALKTAKRTDCQIASHAFGLRVAPEFVFELGGLVDWAVPISVKTQSRAASTDHTTPPNSRT